MNSHSSFKSEILRWYELIQISSCAASIIKSKLMYLSLSALFIFKPNISMAEIDTIKRDHCIIEVKDIITEKDAEETLIFLHNNSCKNISIHLKNSPGGSTSLYAILFEYINSKNALLEEINLEGFCFSTCALIYTGLPRQKTTKISSSCNSLIGFHRSYLFFIWGNVAPAPISNLDILQKLQSVEVPEELISSFLNTGASELDLFWGLDLSKNYEDIFSCLKLKKSNTFSHFDYVSLINYQGIGNFIEIILRNYDFKSSCGVDVDFMISNRFLDPFGLDHSFKNGVVHLDFLSYIDKLVLEMSAKCIQKNINKIFENLNIGEERQFDENFFWEQPNILPLLIIRANDIVKIKMSVKGIYFNRTLGNFEVDISSLAT